MKKITNIMIIISITLLATSMFAYAKSKYDVMIEDKGMQKLINIYDNQVKTSPLAMNYLNEIISSPEVLYRKLVEYDCNPEILKFVKHNKLYTLKLAHIWIILVLNKTGIDDAQMVFVTNYIRSPRAMAATNAQEMGMETMYMRQMPAFLAYEMYTKPGGLKDLVEQIFEDVE